jgi:hypothetical protein
MVDVDVAWVAGIIEGEGAVMLTKNPMRVRVRVCMTDRDVIESLCSKTKLGTLALETWRKRPNRKQVYVWEVRKQNEVQQLLVAIRPFMHSRRTKKIDEVLNWINNRILIKSCSWCQEEFLAAQDRYLFCSAECRIQSRNGMVGMKYEMKVN